MIWIGVLAAVALLSVVILVVALSACAAFFPGDEVEW